MRVWILALSILLAPMASRAAEECPIADGWYRRWVDCEKFIRPLDEDMAYRIRTTVAAHTLEAGSAVTWEEETRALFNLLPEELRIRPALDYIQCREFEQGRICKSQWESRDRCVTMRMGSKGIEFPAGTDVQLAVKTSAGAEFRGASAPLPASTSAKTSGEMRLDDGRLRWDFEYGRGSAEIQSPESAGPWTLSFDDLATRSAAPSWKEHNLDFMSGSSSPHELQIGPATHLSIAWTCTDEK